MAIIMDISADRLINALIQVESDGDIFAIGDKDLKNKAYGCLQIRQPVVDDVNRVLGTNNKAEDMLGNKELSVIVFKAYMDLYATEKRLGRPVTDEDRARIWQGGPNGWRKNITKSYAQKVSMILKQNYA